MDSLSVYAVLIPAQANDPDSVASLVTTYKPYFQSKHQLDDSESNDLYPDIRPYDEIITRMENTRLAEHDGDFGFYIEPHDGAAVTEDMLSKAAAKCGLNLIFGYEPFETAAQEYS